MWTTVASYYAMKPRKKDTSCPISPQGRRDFPAQVLRLLPDILPSNFLQRALNPCSSQTL